MEIIDKYVMTWFLFAYGNEVSPSTQNWVYHEKCFLCRIPGQLNDRRTMLGELNWIFTAITDTIAWNTLPRGVVKLWTTTNGPS